jgi:HK97 gp10 family phage protein
MSKTVEIRFDTREFDRSLQRLGGAQVGAILAQGVAEGMSIVAQEARATAPDSGLSGGSNRKSIRGRKHQWKLKDAIKVKQVKVDARGILGRIVALPFYTQFVERGVPSRGIKPNPFMRKAASNRRPQAISAFQDHVRKAVESAFR